MPCLATGLEHFTALIQDVELYYRVTDIAAAITVLQGLENVNSLDQTNQIFNDFTPVSVQSAYRGRLLAVAHLVCAPYVAAPPWLRAGLRAGCGRSQKGTRVTAGLMYAWSLDAASVGGNSTSNAHSILTRSTIEVCS